MCSVFSILLSFFFLFNPDIVQCALDTVDFYVFPHFFAPPGRPKQHPVYSFTNLAPDTMDCSYNFSSKHSDFSCCSVSRLVRGPVAGQPALSALLSPENIQTFFSIYSIIQPCFTLSITQFGLEACLSLSCTGHRGFK